MVRGALGSCVSDNILCKTFDLAACALVGTRAREEAKSVTDDDFNGWGGTNIGRLFIWRTSGCQLINQVVSTW